MGMDCRGDGGVWVTMHVCVCVSIYISVYWVDDAKKSLRFSGRVRGRKEGKGELRMAFSRSMLLRRLSLAQHDSFVTSFFIYLPSVHFFPSIAKNLCCCPTADPRKQIPPPLLCKSELGPFLHRLKTWRTQLAKNSDTHASSPLVTT